MALCMLASLEAGTGPEPVPEQGSLILVSDNRALIRIGGCETGPL